MESGECIPNPNADEFEDYDAYINMEVSIPREGGRTEATRVISLSHNKSGKTQGIPNNHHLLYTRVFDVHFQDGGIEKLAENRIAVNMYSSFYEYGHKHSEVQDIIIHCKTWLSLRDYCLCHLPPH